MRMGLDREGWSTVWANDIDIKKWQMYRENFADADRVFSLKDVHQVDADELPDIDLATASFPCNDLSLAGARHGLSGSQSSAYWGFIDVLQRMGSRRPPMVLLENVPGFLTSNEGNDFRDALLALNELGYAVDAFMIDAARFVPQSRQRLFVVGSKSGPQNLKETESLFFQADARPEALASFVFLNPEIVWNIRTLPSLPRLAQKLEAIVEDVPFNSEIWWSKERAEYLLGQMSAKHSAIAEQMIRAESISYGTIFRRVRAGRSMGELRTDGIAGCLRTPRGGSGRQILFCAGRGEYRVRLLTPRECARLMGADEYKISVPLNQALFGFGDAVCVPVIEWISRNYLKPLLLDLCEVPTALPDRIVSVRYQTRRAAKSATA
jgi:DNA (cytosine-5)-methyltransferase 1